MSIDPAVHEKFIELRSQGVSFQRIADELKVSKPTLIAWSRQYQTQIDNLRTVHLEALQEKYFALREKRLELFGQRLQILLDELLTRDLKDLPTPRLYDLLLKFSAALKREEKPVTFTHHADVREIEKSFNTIPTHWKG